VEQDVHDVVAPWPGSEEVDVEHEREPGERVPVGGVADAGEGPRGPLRRDPGLDVAIAAYVEVVINCEVA
jgi:hypothetical protein